MRVTNHNLTLCAWILLNVDCIDKHNRSFQSRFKCVDCGFSGLANHDAAINIGHRASVNRSRVSTTQTTL